MTIADPPTQVLIAGGGIAALELLLALRVLADPQTEITLLTAEPELAPRAMSVAAPFGRGGPRTHDWAPIAAEQGADLIVDALVAVDVDQRVVFTRDGLRVPYGELVLATGARRVEPFAGALTFGATGAREPDLRGLIADVLARDAAQVVFTLPSPSIWPLPLYSSPSLRPASCASTARVRRCGSSRRRRRPWSSSGPPPARRSPRCSPRSASSS